MLIVGGGITGLATRLALRQVGVEAELVERAPAWRAGGLGLYLPGNALPAFEALGLAEAVRERAVVVARQLFLSRRGRTLAEVDLPRFWEQPCLAMAHDDLHDLLVAANAEFPVRFGTSVAALREEPDGVEVDFTDGTTSGYRLVVGADGVRSTVRSLSGGPSPRAVGQRSWRFVVAGADGILDWTVLLGRGRAFLLVPLPGDRLYCYADVDADTAAAADGESEPAALRRLFADFRGPVPAVLARLPDRLYRAPIEEVPTDCWGSGRVMLLGDAAHATSPNMAQGVALAVEDASAFAAAAAEHGANPAATAAVARRRTPRTSWVRGQTHRRDRTRGLSGPVRSAVLRLAGSRIYRANYRPLRSAP